MINALLTMRRIYVPTYFRRLFHPEIYIYIYMPLYHIIIVAYGFFPVMYGRCDNQKF